MSILKYAVLKVLRPYGTTAVDDVPCLLIMAKYKNAPHRGKGRFCHYRRTSFLIYQSVAWLLELMYLLRGVQCVLENFNYFIRKFLVPLWSYRWSTPIRRPPLLTNTRCLKNGTRCDLYDNHLSRLTNGHKSSLFQEFIGYR